VFQLEADVESQTRTTRRTDGQMDRLTDRCSLVDNACCALCRIASWIERIETRTRIGHYRSANNFFCKTLLAYGVIGKVGVGMSWCPEGDVWEMCLKVWSPLYGL